MKQVVGVAFLAGVCSILAWVLWFEPQRAQAHLIRHIEQLEDRRLAVENQRRRLENGKLETTYPEGLLWRSSGFAESELSLQTKLGDLARARNLTVSSFGAGRTTSPVEQATFALDMELQGNLSGLYGFLADVEAIRPAVAIGRLGLRPLPHGHEAEEVAAFLQISVWAFWSESN